MLGLGGGLFTFAALFYFAADYEHLSGWKWALASCAVTITINQLFPASFIFVLPAQFGLFLVMWWAHTKNRCSARPSANSARRTPCGSANSASARPGKTPRPTPIGTRRSVNGRPLLRRRRRNGRSGCDWPAKRANVKSAAGDREARSDPALS